MKINLKTNLFIKTTTVIYTVLLIISLYLKIGKATLAPIEYYSFIFFLSLSYILMLIYLISVLKTLKEHKSVINVFIIFTCLEAAKIILGLFSLGVHSNSYIMGLGTLSAIIGMYLMIQTFNIKSPYIAVPYRVFGGSLLVSVGAFLYLTSSSPVVANSNTKDYLDIVKILIPIAVLFILKNVERFIKGQNVRNIQATV